jgi:hypothetical protein
MGPLFFGLLKAIGSLLSTTRYWNRKEMKLAGVLDHGVLTPLVDLEDWAGHASSV